MHRRDALRAVGAGLVGLTGCLDDAGDATGTTTTPSRERLDLGETVENETGDRVSVDSVSVQTSVIHAHTWRDVYDPEGAQMAVLSGSLHGRPGVLMDGEGVERSPRVDAEAGSFEYAVAVPVRDVDSAGVVLHGARGVVWNLPASTREDLGQAASFRVRDGRMGTYGGRPAFELTVENVGDADGTFRGVTALSNDRDEAIGFPVPAGETVTRDVTNPFFGSETTLREAPSPRTRKFWFEN